MKDAMHRRSTQVGRTLLRVAIACCLLAAGAFAPARADIVFDWVELGAAALANAPGAQSTQAKVLARIAMFNALNAIAPRYQSYLPAPEAAAEASPEVAAAMAAWTAFASVPFADRAALDEALRGTLGKVSAGPAKAAGITLGKRAALALLAARAADSFDQVAPSPRAPGPGVYELTPEHRRPSSVQWMRFRPFAIRGLDICEPGPPPAWDSDTAVNAALQSKAIGGRISVVRTADQTAAALFWNSTDDGDEFNVLKHIAEARKLAPLESARMLAVFAVASIDATVCATAMRDKYRFWRPYSAIRGQFALPSVRDDSWVPLFTTPANPDYPSGTATIAGIYERLFRSFNPDNAVPLVWKNKATKQTRSWPTSEAMSTEMASSRIWAGIHSAFAIEAGLQLGRRVADEVLATQMVPLAR
jgi:hypothetical protein